MNRRLRLPHSTPGWISAASGYYTHTKSTLPLYAELDPWLWVGLNGAVRKWLYGELRYIFGWLSW